MSRLLTAALGAAPEKAEALFAHLRKAFGRVPNAYLTLGSSSPLALEAALHMDSAIAASQLSAREVEAIKLTISAANDCDYCVAVHTLIGRMVGFDVATMRALRRGEPSGDARLDALVKFARSLIATRGTVPVSLVDDMRAAGYGDAHITESLLVISAIAFTNLFNRVNDTTLDFPAVVDDSLPAPL